MDKQSPETTLTISKTTAVSSSSTRTSRAPSASKRCPHAHTSPHTPHHAVLAQLGTHSQGYSTAEFLLVFSNCLIRTPLSTLCLCWDSCQINIFFFAPVLLCTLLSTKKLWRTQNHSLSPKSCCSTLLVEKANNIYSRIDAQNTPNVFSHKVLSKGISRLLRRKIKRNPLHPKFLLGQLIKSWSRQNAELSLLV